MSTSLILLVMVTFCYAGYNLLIKVSSSYVPGETTSTILATITLQIAALAVSCLFTAGLLVRDSTALALPPPALMWAALAGICIGTAEIGYFYLFRGGTSYAALAANVAIPVIVGGTILVAIIVSWLFLRESMNWMKAIGSVVIIIGVAMMFVNSKA